MLFAAHAKPIEAQLPFVRGYRHVDNVSPYLLNTSADQSVVDAFLDGLYAYHGADANYVFVQPDMGKEKILSWVENHMDV